MFIDYNRGGEKLQINIDLELKKTPCDVISLDVQDVMGTHVVNVAGAMDKIRLDKNGNYISSEEGLKQGHGDGHEHATKKFDMKRAKDAIKNHEGCRLKG
jgi:hypothetical protein